MRNNVNRRRVLLVTGAAFTTSLAGCSGAEDDEDEDDADLDEAEAEADEEEEDGDEGEEEEEEAEYIDEADDQIELAYGEEAHHSDGIVVVAHGFEFEDQLGDPDFPDEPDQGQFALLEFEARNEGNEAQTLPTAWMDLQLLHDGNQYDPESVVDLGDREEYDGGEVQPDISRDGYIAFDVPDNVGEEDLDTVWHDDFLGANIDVRWTAGG